MSSGSREQLLEELVRELRQFNEFGASFFRVAASRIGLAVTDIQVMDILDLAGPLTAGQLAELTGLTTGAITRILDRLEEAGLVRRERDPKDGRKVIVHFAADKDETRKVRAILDSAGKVWSEVAVRSDDEQLASLLGFLKQSNTLSRQELVQAQQEGSASEGRIFSAPLEGQTSGRLVISGGAVRLDVRANASIAGLYQAHFEGPLPVVKVKDGTVTVRYARRLLGLGEKQGGAEVVLNAAIPWRIAIQGGATEAIAELSALKLTGVDIKGGFSVIRLELPVPSGTVPIQISGGAPEITVRRPAGVAARLNFKGFSSELVFDDQTFSVAGNIVQLQDPGFGPTTSCYDIDITSYSTRVAIISA